MNIDLGFAFAQDVCCSKCGEGFLPDDKREVVGYAGSAFKDGKARWEQGAELFVFKVFHQGHAPDKGVPNT